MKNARLALKFGWTQVWYEKRSNLPGILIFAAAVKPGGNWSFRLQTTIHVKVFETQDGSHSVFSEKFGVSYHSKYGAVQESRHVFIEEGLFFKALTKKHLRVLEMGFGTGLNAFLAFLEAEKRQLKLEYVAVEAYPLSVEMALELNYPAVLDAENRAGAFAAMHGCDEGERVRLTANFTFQKIFQPFEQARFDLGFDLIFFDAFAPNAQPELWEEPLMRKMYEALLPGGVLVTYCAKGSFKRTLKAVGFEVEAPQGPPGKREMVRAIKTIQS